jgi:3-oxoacyl-[acyl-carrier-protein] synthase-3
MPGISIVGSGRYLPGAPCTNTALARVMATSDEWIRQRTGIVSRHYAREGEGVSDLALPAARLALESAGRKPSDIDYILFNTMTPDHLFPGSGPMLAAKLGCVGVPALDLRAQCAAMIFSFQLADGLLASPGVRRILVVGAEAHAAFMPWKDWDLLEQESSRRPSVADYERATKHRGLAVVFGDGAGALLLERTERNGVGLLGLDLHSDGGQSDEMNIPVGFRRGSYASEAAITNDGFVPMMNGREVFRQAVSKLPEAVKAACDRAKVTLEQVDWFLAHQANDRINRAVRERLGVAPEKVPSNIANYGNTSTATIPILVDEMRRDGRLREGQLVCFLALGAGMHWGAAVMRL